MILKTLIFGYDLTKVIDHFVAENWIINKRIKNFKFDFAISFEEALKQMEFACGYTAISLITFLKTYNKIIKEA